MPYVLCELIEQYVENIYIYTKLEWTIITTFGLRFIDDDESERLKHLSYEKICQVTDCELPICNTDIVWLYNNKHKNDEYILGLCEEHTNQWLCIPIIHYHKYNCIECPLDSIDCLGHLLPRNYIC
jgi:hypothetical protein